MKLDCAGKLLNLESPVVMGVLNVTPDSFSDGGRFQSLNEAISQAQRMLSQGAAIIDIGGESTRPNATAVSANEELDRVIPVIEAIHQRFDTVISIDTSKPEVMTAATVAGAGMINDVMALRNEGALEAALAAKVPVCLMHMQGEPRSMQKSPVYADVVNDICTFLDTRIQACLNAGISRDSLLLDPGFGFGKSLHHNLSLMKHLDVFKTFNLPLLVGVSRKSMLGAILNKEVNQRLAGSIALQSLALFQGASIIRAHDVAEAVDACKVCDAVMTAE
jgi:dihydropteroate synthase